MATYTPQPLNLYFMNLSEILSILFGTKQPELIPIPVEDKQQQR
ncbi:MAG: hypothetical protein JWQ40_3117 [Segetibacter sp.]|nr:hypothetical protein [Segetibacter sp.]